MRVLVAEDERVMADTIAEGLRRRAIAVDVCYDGDAALERALVNAYDVVILDRDLPLVHGDEVCRRIIAGGGETRILMLTAAAGIRDRVDGLDLGADDYLTKPFAFAELVARVGSVLDAHEELAGEHGVAVRRKLAETMVPGDHVLLERLTANLVSNAIKYNEPGGWVDVEVVEVAAGPTLTVRNTGPRVPSEAVPALFEPFRRLGNDRVRGRGGVGLGLAIVRSIVIAHEGTIRVRPRAGGGLELEVTLPGGRVPPS